MKINIDNFSQQAWNDIVAPFMDLSLIQSWAYGEAKTSAGKWQIERATIIDNGEPVGACQCMIRYIPFLKRGVIWINRGPLWRKTDSEDLSTLLEMLVELKRYWVEERNMYLLIAPPLSREKADPALFMENGYHIAEDSGYWASGLLDLSLPEKTIRTNLQQKWRNCLNKAERSGIDYVSGIGDESFHLVLEEYQNMMREKGFSGSATPELLLKLQEHLNDDRKLWAIVARHKGKLLGGVLIARYGNTAEYLVGAFNEHGKKVNAGNYLLWQAICQMKTQGFRWFDLGGMHPEKTTKGIFHFKSGVNALPYSLMGTVQSYRNSIVNKGIQMAMGYLGGY